MQSHLHRVRHAVVHVIVDLCEKIFTKLEGRTKLHLVKELFSFRLLSELVVLLYQWNDSLLVLHILLAHHCVGLSSACLTVRKNADVVAFECVEQHLLSNIFVHSHLRGIIDVLGLWTENRSLLNLGIIPQNNTLVQMCELW